MQLPSTASGGDVANGEPASLSTKQYVRVCACVCVVMSALLGHPQLSLVTIMRVYFSPKVNCIRRAQQV